MSDSKYLVVENKPRLLKNNFPYTTQLALEQAIDLYAELLSITDPASKEVGERNFYNQMLVFTPDERVKQQFQTAADQDAEIAYKQHAKVVLDRVEQEGEQRWKDQEAITFKPNTEGLDSLTQAVQDYVCLVEAIKNEAMERVRKPSMAQGA